MLRSSHHLLLVAFFLMVLNSPIQAKMLHVPQDYAKIQIAINAAAIGDTVLVSAGNYNERIKLKPGVNVRSEGDNTKGAMGMKRAEATIINGQGNNGRQPGVLMAEGSTLDGFTITGIGNFDEQVWKKHFDSQGEELSDEQGAVNADGTIPAISIQGVGCIVSNNIVHHNGDVGIAVIGIEGKLNHVLVTSNRSYRNMGGGIGIADFSQAVISGNTCHQNLRAGIGCRNASPIVIGNTCFKNVRAGIGCREGAGPIIRGNECYSNRRAGIGIRMTKTAPLVENNLCYENDMAGIGNRDGAEPIIRNNRCFSNKMAGIGCDGSKPLIVGNECRDNSLAGIGLRGGAKATIKENVCLENKLVAIGVTHGSHATISGNRLIRTGGVPPIIAVKDDSDVTIENNDINGGGVAAILVQGKARISRNRFNGTGDKQGNAVWIWEGSSAIISGNNFDGFRAAVNASKAILTVTGNSITRFQRIAITVKDSLKPAHIYGNRATTADRQAKVIEIDGPAGVVDLNELTYE